MQEEGWRQEQTAGLLQRKPNNLDKGESFSRTGKEARENRKEGNRVERNLDTRRC